MATNYTTKTASLKATAADIRKLAATSVDAGSVQADELTVKNGEGYSSVTDLIDTAVDTAVETAADALADVKTELEGKITEAQEAAAISVGRDTNKDYKVDSSEITALVKQINFLGDYVNVIPSNDGTGNVNVYIGENKSLNEISGLSNNRASTTAYRSYTNDDYTVTGGASVNYNGTKKVGTTSGYDAVTLTSNVEPSNYPVTELSKPESQQQTSTTIFVTDSDENKIWFRTTINGKTGNIASQALNTDLAGKTVTENNVTLTTTNTVITSDHAKYGKIPGQTETSFTFTFDPDNLVPKGGSIKLEWAISKTEPTAWKSVDFFYGEYTQSPTATAITAAMTKEVLTPLISGMQYVTAESEVNVKVASLTNSQNKLSTSLNRFQITDPTNSTTTYAVKADGTMTAGMSETSGKGVLSSSAVFALDKTLKTGSKVAASSFTITGKTWDYNDTDTKPSVDLTSATIKRPYYGTVKDSTDLIEYFSNESRRTDNNGAAWGDKSKVLFTKDENTIGGRVPAIVQMGNLYHPANASIIADANGKKPASADGEAVFYRTIIQNPNSTSGCAAMKLTGNNLTNSNVKLYLTGINSDDTLQAKTWIINKESSYSDSVGTGIAAAGKLTGSEIQFDFSTAFESRPPQNKGFLLTIVLGKSAPALGPMTFSIL